MDDNFNPFDNGGARTTPTARSVFQSGSTGGGADTREINASNAPDSDNDFNPFNVGASPISETPEQTFNPFNAGAQLENGEDIQKRSDEDPNWVPSNQELRTLKEYQDNLSLGQKAGNAVKAGVKSLVNIPVSAVKGVGEVLEDPSASRAAATALEGASQTGTGLWHMLTAIPKGLWNLGKNIAAPGLAAPAAAVSAASPEAQEKAFQDWKMDYLTQRALPQQSNAEAFTKWATDEGEPLPEKAITTPYPNLSNTLGLAGQIAAGNAGALGAAGAAINEARLAAAGTGTGLAKAAIENVGKAIPKTLGENALNKAGEVTENVGGVVNKIGAAPRNLVKNIVTKVAGEDLADKAAMFAQGTLAHNPVVRGLAAAEGGGALAEQVGQGLQAVANQPYIGPFSRLVNLSKNLNAPDWLRGMAQNRLVKSIYGAGESALPVITGAAKGTAKGAIGGAVFGALSGDSPEELGGDIAQFAAFGGLHGGKSAPDAQILQRRSAGVMDLVSQNIADGVSPETIAKVPDAAMMAAADVPFLGIKDGQGQPLKVRFTDNSGAGGHGRMFHDVNTNTIFLNADELANNKASWSTIFHEMLHPLFDSEVANHPELSAAIDKAVTDGGRTLDQAKYTYSYNLLKPDLRAEGVTDPLEVTNRVNNYIKERDDNSQAVRGDKDHWIRSEILADAGRDSMGSAKFINSPEGAINSLLKSRASSAMLDVLQRMGVDLKPDSLGKTVIPGFQNVVADPSLRKSVYKLLKAQRDNTPGMGKETEQQVKLSPADMGTDKAPFYNLPNGRRGNKYSEEIPDGKGGTKVVMRNPRQIKKAEQTEKQAMKKYLTPGQRISAMPPGFYADPEIGEWTKQAANIMEQSIKAGQPLEGWYHGLGKSGEADWRASVKKNLGNVTASHQQFYPLPNGIFTSKAGNTLADVASISVIDRKAQKWMNRSGPLSLEQWGGDIRKFRADVDQYNQNHAQGLAGDANNIGGNKKNVINAFLYGRNVKFEQNNPLRSLLRGSEDRQGVVRSLRLDRLETLHPSETDIARPDYQRGVKNYSPATELPLQPGDRLVTMRRPDGSTYDAAFGDKYMDLSLLGRGKVPSIAYPTPKGWSHGLPGRGDVIEERGTGEQTAPVKTPDTSAQSVIDQAASERQYSPESEGPDIPRNKLPKGEQMEFKADPIDFDKSHKKVTLRILRKDMPEGMPSLFGNVTGDILLTGTGSNKSYALKQGYGLLDLAEKGYVLDAASKKKLSDYMDALGPYKKEAYENAAYPSYKKTIEGEENTKSLDKWLEGDYQARTARERRENPGIIERIKNWNELRKAVAGNVSEPFLTQKAAMKVDWLSAGRRMAEESSPEFLSEIGGRDKVNFAAQQLEGMLKAGGESQGRFGESEGGFLAPSTSFEAPREFDIHNYDDKDDGGAASGSGGPLFGGESYLWSKEGEENKPKYFNSKGFPQKMAVIWRELFKYGREQLQDRGENPAQYSPKASGKLENVVGDEKISLVHLSSQRGLKTVSPEFFGKGKANNNDLRGGPKSYFFVKGSPLGGDENIFGQGGYNAHTAEVSGSKIYDLSVGKPDPLGYFKTINREEADDNIKDAGYDGIKVGTTDGRQVVMMFKPVPVKSAGEFAGTKAVVPKPQFSPEAESKTRTPNYDVREVAEDYMKGKGEAGAHGGYAPLNEELGKKTADWYNSAQHAPQDEAVKKSYDALKKESVEQWNAATKAGFKFEPWTKEGQPYKNSAEMASDVAENKHLYYFTTEAGFGTGEATEKSAIQHPLLESSGIKDAKGNDIPVNDVFRAVHDLYGHAKEGYEFGPRGELNAYLAHSKMFSDEAKPAMGAETMGQNSWVNFGKHLRDKAGNIPKKGEPGYIAPQDRPFAEQKATVLPPEIAKEASGAKQYSPQTTYGKDLERAGYKIEVEDYGAGGLQFEVTNGEGQSIASMTAAITSKDSAYLTMVSVASKEQGKGIGTALYHELANSLQKKGIKQLDGTVINPKALELRKKVLGNAETQKTGDVTSTIDPNKQFSPPPEDYKGEYVKEAAIKIGDKVFTGTYHGLVQDKIENSSWFMGQAPSKRSALVSSMEDGFTTNTGRFIDRDEALNLAKKAKQITEEGYTETAKKNRGRTTDTDKYLESGNFENAKSFSPKSEPTLDDKDAARYAKRIAALTTEKGGTTFNVAEGKSVGEGKVYGVSIYPDRSVIVEPKDLTPERVQSFIKNNADLLKNPENTVGTWFDKESGKTYLDVSVGLKDRALAEYAGFKYNQKAIWDSAAGKEIPTGGSGEALEHMPEATERLDKLRREYEVQNPTTGQQQIPGMGRIVLNPKSDEVKNTRDIEAVRPDRELTPTERAASDLARKELKDRVQLLPNIDDKVKVRRAFQRGVAEVSEFLDKQATNPNFDSGSDWYGKDIKKMEATTHLIFPETKNADKMTMFKLLLASFSGGETPKANYQLACEAFAHYLRTGEVPATSDYRISETGQKRKLGQQATMTAEKLSGLMDKTGGEAGFVKYLLTKHEETLGGNKDAYGALDLGPKFGRFFLNLMGHSNEVTVDLWATRTWQRWMGTPFSGEGKAMPDIPTDAERNAILQSFKDIADGINNELPKEQHLTPMAVQAMLWFYEKDLYAARGVKVDRGTFSQAASDYAKNPIHKREKPVVTGSKVDMNQIQMFSPKAEETYTEMLQRVENNSRNHVGNPQSNHYGNTDLDAQLKRAFEAGNALREKYPEGGPEYEKEMKQFLASNRKQAPQP